MAVADLLSPKRPIARTACLCGGDALFVAADRTAPCPLLREERSFNSGASWTPNRPISARHLFGRAQLGNGRRMVQTTRSWLPRLNKVLSAWQDRVRMTSGPR